MKPRVSQAAADPASPNHSRDGLNDRHFPVISVTIGACLKMRKHIQKQNDPDPYEIDEMPIERHGLVGAMRGAQMYRRNEATFRRRPAAAGQRSHARHGEP